MNIKIFIGAIIFISSFTLFAQPSPLIDKKPYKKILLIIAMDKEAKPIIKAFNLKKSLPFPHLPMQNYKGKYGSSDIFMVVNGTDPMYKVQNVGTQPATLSTYLGIKHFRPDLVISIGTAGGVAKNGAQINHIYASKKIYFYDRRIPVGQNYPQYGFGGYPSATLRGKTNFETGIVCSGDSFDTNQTDALIIQQQNCTAIDMEAAGVAWTSMLMRTPMLAIKGITNYAQDKNGADQYEENFSSVMKMLAEGLKQILKSNL